ncbi:hypothetical protein HK104_004642 [Borealophlyctis nickersoniae]|nr:hypothetical protein HK104_004642 [Borealophlyctis nickersoniae]
MIIGVASYYIPQVAGVTTINVLLHRNSKLLRELDSEGPQNTFTRALIMTQILRMTVFFGIEIAGCIYGVYPYDTPIPLVLVYNILKPTRAFLIVTDVDRMHALAGMPSRDDCLATGERGTDMPRSANVLKSQIANLEDD